MLFAGIGLFLLALAAICWMLYRRNVAKAAQAASWPRAEGIVEASGVVYHAARGSDDSDSWSVELRYRYMAGGAEQTGNRVRFGPNPTYHVERKATEEAARYPAGATVSVAYNPAKPAESVLETDRASSSWRTFAFILTAIAIAFIGFGFLPTE